MRAYTSVSYGAGKIVIRNSIRQGLSIQINRPNLVLIGELSRAEL